MLGNELGQFKHADRFLAVEDRFHFVVGIDLSSHLLVLKAIFLDIVPELFCELRTGQGFRTDDDREDVVRLNRFEECSVGFTSGFFSHNGIWVYRTVT